MTIAPHHDMVLVEGGRFLMGEPSADFTPESRPVHVVELSSFHIHRHPVTQKLWQEAMGNNPSSIKNEMSPIEMVSWFDAAAFCNELSLSCGLKACYEFTDAGVTCSFDRNGFRLPTEAEWEYAARGGKSARNYRYSGSNNIDDVAWYKGNSKGAPHDVGMKKPNDLGLLDMSGNIWEWCWDWYGKYPDRAIENPAGPSSGETRVYRGGSYLDFDYGCTVFVRGKRSPKLRQTDIGFRLARSHA